MLVSVERACHKGSVTPEPDTPRTVPGSQGSPRTKRISDPGRSLAIRHEKALTVKKKTCQSRTVPDQAGLCRSQHGVTADVQGITTESPRIRYGAIKDDAGPSRTTQDTPRYHHGPSRTATDPPRTVPDPPRIDPRTGKISVRGGPGLRCGQYNSPEQPRITAVPLRCR